MKKLSQCIKVDMIDYAPKLESAGPDKIVATSGVLTTKMENFKEMLERIDDKVLKGFHNEATRRGHASLTTSVNFYFWIEGSRISDFYFSSFPFGSYLVFSSRRIEIGPESMIIPDSIAESQFKDEYEKVCKTLIDLYNKVKEKKGIDYARRILPIGFVSRLFFNLPLQVVLGIIKEAREDNQRKSPTMPKEIVEIANSLEDCIRSRTNYLADASLKLPYDTNFPHPDLFKGDIEFKTPETKILSKDEKLEKILAETKEKLTALKDSNNITKSAEIWKEFVEKIQNKILVEANIISSLSAWNDIKRHRSVRQKVESIYHAADRCIKKSDNWNDDYFYMPPVENEELKGQIIAAYKEALRLYEKMVNKGIEKRDAIYIIPHAINLGIHMFLDGYHIFDPFGFLGIRTCTTTDHEVTKIANRIMNELRKELPVISDFVGPKCKLGYCPERNFCGLIKRFVKDYDEKLHAGFQ